MAQPQITLNGDFEARPKTALAPGDWYLAFQCRACRRGIAWLDDPTGTGAIALGGEASIALLCPGCGVGNRFSMMDARVIQAPTGGVTAPPEIFGIEPQLE